MLALLGWNPGTEQEIFSMDELVEAFSMERVGKSGSKFDPEKAKWFNHHYLSQLPDEEVAELLKGVLEEKGFCFEKGYLVNVAGLIKERAVLIPDLWEQSHFFFVAPETYDDKVKQKFWKLETPVLLQELIAFFEPHSDFSTENLDVSLKAWIQGRGLGMGQIMNTLRLVLVGGSFGPGVAAIASTLGKREVIDRIQNAIDKLGTKDV